MKPIFRNSMFGFNKEDVVAFVAKQNAQTEERLQEMKNQKDKLERELRAEIEEIQFAREELEQLRAEKESRVDSVNTIRVLAEKLKEVKGRFDGVCDESESAVARLSEDAAEVRAKLAEALKYREKAGRFDKLATVLGEIFTGNKQEERVLEETETAAPEDNNAGELALESVAKENKLVLDLLSLCEEISVIFDTITKE